MKALNLHGVGDLRLDELPAPAPKAGDVLLKIRAAGICGSDIGRVFQMGTYHFPTVIGHEFAGEIVEAENKNLIGRGAAVFPLIPCRKCAACREEHFAQCENYGYYGSRQDGGMAEYLAVKRENLCILPENVSYEEAAMTEPAAVALAAWHKSGTALGDTVLIYGIGAIALILAQWAKLAGANQIILIARSDEKVKFARNLGFDLAFNVKKIDLTAKIDELTDGRGVDAAFEGTGRSEGLNNCLKTVRRFGTVLALGNPAEDMRIEQKMYSRLLRQEIKLVGTWNSRHGTSVDDWRAALEAMRDKRINLLPLITHKFSLNDYAEAFGLMRDKKEFFVKVIFFASGGPPGA